MIILQALGVMAVGLVITLTIVSTLNFVESKLPENVFLGLVLVTIFCLCLLLVSRA